MAQQTALPATTNAERFVANTERRVNQALDAIRKLGFVANPKLYDYTDEQVDAVLGTLRGAVDDLEKKFRPAKPKAGTFQLPAFNPDVEFEHTDVD